MTLLRSRFRIYMSRIKRLYTQGGVDFDQFLTDASLRSCAQKFGSVKGLEEWKHLKKEASVLIPLCHVDRELSLLYTLRTNTLRRHSGQVSFPGGMRDPTDETAEETATRETEEEIGILRENIRTYGCGSVVGRRGVRIVPVVGYIGSVCPADLKINPKEVQMVFTLPIAKFCDLSHCRYTKFRSGYTLPVFTIDDHRVWGITAYITHVFLRCLLGETYPFSNKFLSRLY